jgi:hypothetical protein
MPRQAQVSILAPDCNDDRHVAVKELFFLPRVHNCEEWVRLAKKEGGLWVTAEQGLCLISCKLSRAGV